MTKFIYVDLKPVDESDKPGTVRLVNIDQIEDIYVNENYEVCIIFSSGRVLITDEDWNQLESKLGGATHNSDINHGK